MARGTNFKVGLFVIAATIILIVTVVLVAGIGLHGAREKYRIRFAESVSGLDPGAPVKYRGVTVGSVLSLTIPKNDFQTVQVDIAVRKGTPVRTDTKAKLSSVGITGLKFVDLYGGTAEAGPLPPDSLIPASESLIETLTGRATTAAEKVDVLLDNLLLIVNEQDIAETKRDLGVLQQRSDTLLAVTTNAAGHLDSLLAAVNGIAQRNQERIDRSLIDLEGSLHELHATLTEVREGELVANLNETVALSRQTMADVRSLVSGNRRTVSETLTDLHETAANLRVFSRLVREKPSLLIRSSTEEPRGLPGSD